MIKSKPIAVLISDVHYSLATLEIADKAFKAAIDKASNLNVPLIDCGDLTNDKAIIRGEVANRLIETFKYAKLNNVDVTLLIGNHSLINEKSLEHSLNFLQPYCYIIDTTRSTIRKNGMQLFFVPYNGKPPLDKAEIYIMHQGLKGAHMGHYVQDKTSQDPSNFAGLRVISGHYHRAQDIPLPNGGMWSYVGNPYTLTFAEAFDPPKGYAVLYEDGSLERIPLNLRKHVVITYNVETNQYVEEKTSSKQVNANDIVKVVLEGPQSLLTNVNKQKLVALLNLPNTSFKLELQPYKVEEELTAKQEQLLDHEILDGIIDSLPETNEQRARLKQEWRELVK